MYRLEHAYAAAAVADCEIHLAQVAIDERGSAEFGGYKTPRHGRCRHEDEGDDGNEGEGDDGNEGASFERSDQCAALVLWPRACRRAVINQGALPSKPSARLPPTVATSTMSRSSAAAPTNWCARKTRPA